MIWTLLLVLVFQNAYCFRSERFYWQPAFSPIVSIRDTKFYFVLRDFKARYRAATKGPVKNPLEYLGMSGRPRYGRNFA